MEEQQWQEQIRVQITNHKHNNMERILNSKQRRKSNNSRTQEQQELRKQA
jgi:hypothetical protein